MNVHRPSAGEFTHNVHRISPRNTMSHWHTHRHTHAPPHAHMHTHNTHLYRQHTHIHNTHRHTHTQTHKTHIDTHIHARAQNRWLGESHNVHTASMSKPHLALEHLCFPTAKQQQNPDLSNMSISLLRFQNKVVVNLDHSMNAMRRGSVPHPFHISGLEGWQTMSKGCEPGRYEIA